jgi:tetratricopeptide (TPR) repeat protein
MSPHLPKFMPRQHAPNAHAQPVPSISAKSSAKADAAQMQTGMGNRALSRMMYPGAAGTKAIQREEAAVPLTPEQDARRSELFSAAMTRAGELYAAGDYVKAARAYTKLLDQESGRLEPADRAVLMLQLGQCNFGLKRFPAALHFYREAEATGAVPEASREELAARMQTCRDKTGVETDEAGVVDLLELEDVKKIFARAEAQYQAGNFGAAIRGYMQIIDSGEIDDKARAMILYNLGQANRNLGRTATALAYYLQAKELGLPAGFVARADERIPELRQALGIGTDLDGDVLSLLEEEAKVKFLEAQTAYYQTRDYAAARALYSEALAMCTDQKMRGTMYFNIAQCDFMLGNYAEALPNYEHAVALGGFFQTDSAERNMATCQERLSGENAAAP